MAKISSQVVNDLKKQIDESIGPEGLPGTVYCAVNKNGDLIFEHAAGESGLGKGTPMTMDTVFWIASCTKMITGIAAMQLVEQGKLSLDDAEQVEKLAPVSLGDHREPHGPLPVGSGRRVRARKMELGLCAGQENMLTQVYTGVGKSSSH